MGISLDIFNKDGCLKDALELVDMYMGQYTRNNCEIILLEQHGIPYKADVATFYCCPDGIFVRSLNDWSFEHEMGMECIPTNGKTQFGYWFFYSSKIKIIADYLNRFGINTP